MLPSQFTRIEQLVICGICYEYIETCVMTPCSHNYCSLCIRKYLHYKTECPTCFEETFEKDLRVNKALDEVVLCISEIKSNIPKFSTTENVQIIHKSPPDSNVVNKTPSTPKQINNALDSDNDYSTVFEPKVASPIAQKITEQLVNSPSTSVQYKIHSIFTPKTKKPQQSTHKNSPVNRKTVMCPVCKVDVSEVNINRHLDDCLKRQDGTLPVPKPQPKRKPLPKLVFSLMKDAELRKKLKEMKLSSQGDRKVLEARLQKYITLYNAECDKSNPRPVLELIKQCEEEEFLEKKVQKTSSVANKLQINRNTEQNIIEEAQRKYLEANKDSFASLIAKARSTTTPKKPIARRSIFEQSPCKKQAVSSDDINEDTETAGFHRLDSDDFINQDSDTETFCPLQTYSSEDPRRFLAVTMSNTTSNDFTKEHTSSIERKHISPPCKPSSSSLSTPLRNAETCRKDISVQLDHLSPTKTNSYHDNSSSSARSNSNFSIRDNARSSFSLHSPSNSPSKLSTESKLKSHYFKPQSRCRIISASSSNKNISIIPVEDAKSTDSEASESDFVNVSISPVIQTNENRITSWENKTRSKITTTKEASLPLKKMSNDVDSLDFCTSDARSDDLRERQNSCDLNLKDSIVKDFFDEWSSNDSFSSKVNYDKTNNKNLVSDNMPFRVILSDNPSDYTNVEKENQNCISDNAIVHRSVRKRIREIHAIGDEKCAKRERRTRKVLSSAPDGSKDLSKGETHVSLIDGNKKLPKSFVVEEIETIPVIVNDPATSRRKSARTKNKNGSALGGSNNSGG